MKWEQSSLKVVALTGSTHVSKTGITMWKLTKPCLVGLLMFAGFHRGQYLALCCSFHTILIGQTNVDLSYYTILKMIQIFRSTQKFWSFLNEELTQISSWLAENMLLFICCRTHLVMSKSWDKVGIVDGKLLLECKHVEYSGVIDDRDLKIVFLSSENVEKFSSQMFVLSTMSHYVSRAFCLLTIKRPKNRLNPTVFQSMESVPTKMTNHFSASRTTFCEISASGRKFILSTSSLQHISNLLSLKFNGRVILKFVRKSVSVLYSDGLPNSLFMNEPSSLFLSTRSTSWSKLRAPQNSNKLQINSVT